MNKDRSRKAPFPWFGGKSSVAAEVWARLGSPQQYIEPFCGSAAMLLAAPRPASLEVIGDANCYVANFWRALKFRPGDVTIWQDYPVSHIDLYARHRWLTDPSRIASLRESLIDPDWPGDAKIAGWWLWGQCSWIGSGWCDPARGQLGKGTTLGAVPHTSDAGRGVQATTLGAVPHTSDAGRGVHQGSGMTHEWLMSLAARLERVRIIHGDWSRCLNHHYGAADTAIFFDPPYLAFEKLYSDASAPVAAEVAAWCREHGHLRIALCGHRGDYDIPGWDIHDWSRGRLTYGSDATTEAECIWFSPACEARATRQPSLFPTEAS